MRASNKLSNIQLELLKTFGRDIPDEQLLEIKQLLAEYFAQKATEAMDAVWKDKNFDENTIQEWKSTHMRTPYNRS